MGRTPRKSSSISTYHVILRGINKQIIFEDENDYHVFLDSLDHYKPICNYEILSYCLMTNHVHLLMKFNGESISDSIKKITDWYVWRYNRKYERCGHLFQERFKSEPVEDNRYLLTVARYILQNPFNAGMTQSISYKWSSFFDYKNVTCNSLTDTEIIINLFKNHDELMDYFEAGNKDYCMESYSFRANDSKALQVLKKISGCKSIAEFQRLKELQKMHYLKKCLDVGMNVSQLSRLTGISKKSIKRIQNLNIGQLAPDV